MRILDNRFFRFLTFGVGISIIGALLYHFNKNTQLLELFRKASILKILLFCFAGFAVNTISMAITQIAMAASMTFKIRFFESIALSVLTRAGNALTPFRMGTVYRAVYLKKHHQMTISQFGAIFLSLQLVMIISGSLISGISLGMLSFEYRHIGMEIPVLLFSIFVVSSILIFRPVTTGGDHPWFGRYMARFLEGCRALQQSHTSFFIAILGRVSGLVAYTIIYYFTLRELGAETGWLSCLFLASVSSLTMLIQIIPGSLGITETVVIFLSVHVMLPPHIGFSAALLIRLWNILFMIVLTLPSWIYLKPTRVCK
ncbi:MAG: flippase-like domain-containing protein [Deltaproteobacteria bacterium]|nr:flippase-like domain-containing protein [Deltaproteobacteria bacterium]